MMVNFRRFFSTWMARLYGGLLPLYPPEFRAEFGGEIGAIFLEVLAAAEARGAFWLLITALRELTALVISIQRERWYAHRSGKEHGMRPETYMAEPPGGGVLLQRGGTPGLGWIAVWTVVTTAALPATLFFTAPFAAVFMGLLDLGVRGGLLPGYDPVILEPLGFIVGFSIFLAGAQWLMLRPYLSPAYRWFLVTAAGLLLGGCLAGVGLWKISAASQDPDWFIPVVYLLFGIFPGLAQWLFLRRTLSHAYWIIAIEGLAAASILLSGDTFTSSFELAILILPGLVSGVGLWLLLWGGRPEMEPPERKITSQVKGKPFPRIARLGLGLAGLAPLFFLCIWVYAVSELALAKNGGIYATPQEAVIANNSQGCCGAKVVKLENIRVSPNRGDGSQPFLWFGGATVYLDRTPQGRNWSHYVSGSYYMHVKEGWVFIPEGAFPEFIGWVMQLYGLEGVNQYQLNRSQ